jgi:hypothetical protein
MKGEQRDTFKYLEVNIFYQCSDNSLTPLSEDLKHSIIRQYK